MSTVGIAEEYPIFFQHMTKKIREAAATTTPFLYCEIRIVCTKNPKSDAPPRLSA